MPDGRYVDSDPYNIVANALGKADQSLDLPGYAGNNISY